MASIAENIRQIEKELAGTGCRLIGVTKTKSVEEILDAYETGLRTFGENKVQELEVKQRALPRDIEWHMIGHLQTNKIKYIASFVTLIHSVDSFKLLQAIDKAGAKINRIIPCLLQISIADEETKYGFAEEELFKMLKSKAFQNLKNVQVGGVMGIATHTDDEAKIREEFAGLHNLFRRVQLEFFNGDVFFKEISMGMTHDYKLALQEGSTMVRIGSGIFGERNYATNNQ